MKKFFIAFLAFTCISLCMVNATNYTGTLVVKVNNSTEYENQSTVTVTLSGENAKLELNSFSFAGIPVSMNITLNCKCVGGELKEPATLVVGPTAATLILGKLQLQTVSGTLNDNQCSLNMSVYSPTLNKDILITFN